MITKAIFFDFDNTIANDAPFIIECFEYTFNKLGIKNNLDINLFGPTEYSIFSKLLDDEKKIKEALDVFSDYYIKNYKKGISIFPGIREVLERLKQDFKLSLITNSYKYRLKNILPDAYDFFDSIVTVDDVERKKPDPEGVWKSLKELNLNKENIVYVGDSLDDLLVCKLLEIKFIRVLWGDKFSFESTDFSYVDVESPEELLDIIYKKLS